MRRLFALAGPLLRSRLGAVSLSCLLALLTAAAGVALLGVSGWFLSGAALASIAGQGLVFNLFGPSAAVRGLALVRILSRYGERVASHSLTLRLLTDLRSRVFGRLLRLDAGQLSRWRDGELVARLTGDVDALDSAFLLALLPLWVGAACGALVVALLVVYVPLAAPVVAVLWLCVLLVIPAWLVRRVRRAGRRRQQGAAEVRQQVLQAMEGHADLLALNAAGRAEVALADSCAQLQEAGLSESRLFALGQGIAVACAGLATLVVAGAGASALAQGRIGGALLVGLVLAVAGLFEVVTPLLRTASRMGAAAAAAQRVTELEQAEPLLQQVARPRPLPAQGELQFESVCFRHDPGLPLLEGIDFGVTPGQRVLLRGASGGGKSTLLALLLRLRDPQAGTIRWGGVPLHEAALDEVHARIGLLAQDAPVFLGTVRDNLRIGDGDADDAALWQALRQAGLEGEVRAMPEGLDQWLGEGGRTLSAGQARRLCLARVLLGKHALVALDEPTEGLHREAELAFFNALPQVFAGRSLVVVSHANPPPGVFDAVWELREGRLQPTASMGR